VVSRQDADIADTVHLRPWRPLFAFHGL